MNYAPYPDYEPADVESLGAIPRHWKIMSLGHIGRFSASGIDKVTTEGDQTVLMVNYTDVYGSKSKLLDRSQTFMQTTCPTWKASEHSLARGDILFTPSSETEAEVGFSAVVADDMPDTVYSYHLIRLRPDVGVGLDLTFSKYVGNNTAVLAQFSASCMGTTRQILTRDAFRGIVIPLPPLDEQRAIANFLDAQVAKIDALIAKKRELIEKLKEKCAALISRAVTRGLPPEADGAAGLDPNPRLKPSGIEWLGEVPEHWEVKRLKFISPKVTVGIVVEPSKYYEDAGVPCLRSLNVQPYHLVMDDLVFISEESNELHSKSKIFAGDLVAVRSGQPGTTAVVDGRFDGANCIDLIIIRQPYGTTSRFLEYFLNSDIAQAQFELGTGGAIQQHFNITTAANLLIVRPPNDEQDAITHS